MKISITVCNVCQDKDRETLRYEIRSDGRKVILDLCEEHRQPLEEVMPKGDSSGRARPSSAIVGASRRSPRAVVTLEEIGAQKQRERGKK